MIKGFFCHVHEIKPYSDTIYGLKIIHFNVIVVVSELNIPVLDSGIQQKDADMQNYTKVAAGKVLPVALNCSRCHHSYHRWHQINQA